MQRNRLIQAHSGVSVLLKKNGNTENIIDAVMYADQRSAPYTASLARHLSGNSVLQTARNIHGFIQKFIQYKIDPLGKQYIQSPGRLWHTRQGDCKSFSVFAGSILQNLNIPYGYRFTSYDAGIPTPKHVYVYIPVRGGSQIVIDAVWKGPFNTEKRFEYKRDILTAHAPAAVAGMPVNTNSLLWLTAGYFIIKKLAA